MLENKNTEQEDSELMIPTPEAVEPYNQSLTLKHLEGMLETSPEIDNLDDETQTTLVKEEENGIQLDQAILEGSRKDIEMLRTQVSIDEENRIESIRSWF